MTLREQKEMTLEDIEELISLNKQVKKLCYETIGIIFRVNVNPEKYEGGTTQLALWYLCEQNIKALNELKKEYEY